MSKLLIRTITCFIFFSLLATLTACDSVEPHKKIGLILPLQHKAMDEIVAGFTETLQKDSPQKLEFKIANAQNDLNLQRAIIQQMKNEKYDILVPIGTVATQMTLAMVHDQPILGIAAAVNEKDRQAQKNCHMTAVHDEIPVEQIIAFIHSAYPHLSHLTLIHSTSDKVFPDVAAAIQAGKKLGIVVKPLMIQSLAELYSAANALDEKTQGLLILKDHLIVSGISTLSLRAAKLKIPLITSDQGSVEEGGGFGLGVRERMIGVEGAKLAKAILSGQPICQLPIVNMTQLTVFLNRKALQLENQSLDNIRSAALKQKYTVEVIE